MKFVDTIDITVIAGDGGRGFVSFKKNKIGCILSGKGNSSNGGDGGDVWLLADSSFNNLNYFHSCRIFKAGNGECGKYGGRTGKRGKDIFVKVPWGTRILQKRTNKVLGNMNSHQKCLMVAKGGRRGIGNNGHYKSHRYQTSQTMYGDKGEQQHLLLELLLIADVGVFGLPNSGKSSFVRAVSHAKPKIASYPFTTLMPYLGVVRVNNNDRFIVADIPGIIKGASAGLGLGMKFLKHLECCKMLLHFVDIAPVDCSDPVKNIITIKNELLNFNSRLACKPCWLVFNKIDLLEISEIRRRIAYIVNTLCWGDRYYYISSMYRVHVSFLCKEIMQFIINDQYKYDDSDIHADVVAIN